MIYLFTLLVLFTLPVHAHESQDPAQPVGVVIPAAIEKSTVKITEDGTYRYIKSNGIANHQTGDFPNRNNPNSISAQSHSYRVLLNPKKLSPQDADSITHDLSLIGVALNGVPFEPGTAECYGRSRGQRGPMSTCEWREEAIVNGKGMLGLDNSNAHVQPTGAYHYHGVPHGFLSVLPKGDIVHVGYAADGFKLLVSRSGAYRPSYRLKSGTRPSGPGGRYDGKYTDDYAYAAAKVGDLDECNGGYVDEIGGYAYFITEGFPFAPRCLMGVVDQSFARRGPPQGRDGRAPGRRPPPRPY